MYMAHVSKHLVGAHERRYKVIDTSEVPQRLRDKLTYHAFGHYRPDANNFKEMAV